MSATAPDGSAERPVVLTGATGFLGGHLLAALVERGGHAVVLGRAFEGRSLADRITALLCWFGLGDRRRQVEAVEVDLRLPCCGLESGRYDALRRRVGPIVHAASDTRFSERHRDEIAEANVQGLTGILDLAADGRAPFFHYVSTAYVAGRTSGPCREVPVHAAGFWNVYEETKARAEHEVAARCARDGIAYTLIRPSIVYGDSRSGRSTRFNALYHPVKSLAYLREIYLNDLQTQGGQRARAGGIALDGAGVLRLPMRLFLPRRGRVDLIPIDYFVTAVMLILEHADPGGIYHLTSDSPKTIDDLRLYSEAFLRVEGLEIVEGSPDGAPLSPPEALFQRLVEPYLPYLADARTFDRRQADRVTGGLRPPELSQAAFDRCMAYAVSVDWGRAGLTPAGSRRTSSSAP